MLLYSIFLYHRLDTITMGDPVRNATMNFLVDPFREDIIPYPEPLFLAVRKFQIYFFQQKLSFGIFSKLLKLSCV